MILRQVSRSRLGPPFKSGFSTRSSSLAPRRPLAPRPSSWRGHGFPGLSANAVFCFSGRSLHSCRPPMERPRSGKEPPHKRRRSAEDAARAGQQGAAPSRDFQTLSRWSSETRGSGGHEGRIGERSSEPRNTWSAWSRTQSCRSRSDHKDRPPESLRHQGPEPVQSVRPTNPWRVSARQPVPRGPEPPVRPPPVRRLRRRWETCSPNLRPAEGRAFDFSVLTYNILSQQLLQDNEHLYDHCPPDVLTWSHRLPNLLRELETLEADVVCLQEVQDDHFQLQIEPALQARGYQCEFKKRTGSKPDGCVVAFRRSRLTLVSSQPVEFFRPGDALLNRDNVGLVLLLRCGEAGAPALCVANTHLLYNPRRGDVKLAQLAVLLAEISRLTRLHDDCPVLLCGDLNSTPSSPLYSFLTRGHLDCQHLQIHMVSGQEKGSRGQRLLQTPIWSHSLGINRQCEYEQTTGEENITDLSVEDLTCEPVNRWTIEHRIKLRSSYKHLLTPDGRPEITTFHSRASMTVDYILYTPETSSSERGRGLQLLGRLSLVGSSELEAINGLPNPQHSSDHLPLLARFRLRR